MKKLFLVVAILCVSSLAHAQGYSYENFSQFSSGHTLATSTDTGTDGVALYKGWFGTGNPGGLGNAAIQNSTGVLTIQSASACPGTPTGHTGNYLDYNTNLSYGGAGNQIIYLNWISSATVPTAISYWFCSTIPVSADFTATFDAFQLIGGPSRLSNYTSNGSAQTLTIESGSTGTSVPYTPNNWVHVVAQYVNNAACTDTVNFTDCIVLRAYNTSGTLLGTAYSSGGTGTPSYANFGDGNAFACAVSTPCLNAHVQYSDIKIYNIGYSVTQLNSLGATPPPWDGIVTPNRGIDWTQAGFPGDTLPDSAWTQCGSTLAAGTYTGATITSNISGCGPNQYYSLGAGTVNFSGQIAYPTSGKVVIRGQGPNSTTLAHTGSGATTCKSVSCAIYFVGTDTSLVGSGTARATLSGSLAQGSTTITLTQLSGGPAPADVVVGSILLIDACDTNTSGVNCGTGTTTDNSNDYRCSTKYAATPSGCSSNTGNAGQTLRGTEELHTVTAISGGSCSSPCTVTITPPIQNAVLASLNNPQAQVFQPVVQDGLENLTLDTSVAGSPVEGVQMVNCYQCWTTGVKFNKPTQVALDIVQGTNNLVESNYLYDSTASGQCNSPCGIRPQWTGNNLIANNICQQVEQCIFFDGDSTGDALVGNFCVGASIPASGSNDLLPCITYHDSNYYELVEQNVANQWSADDVHGTGDHITGFRDFLTGWDSVPAAGLTAFTNALGNFAFSRYFNSIASVYGTPGFHTNYSATNGNGTYVLSWGAGFGAPTSPPIPADSLGLSTSLLWASYDSQTAAVRFCGNSLDTGWSGTCSTTSESPVSASTYPGFVPVVGDTAIGQAALPASFVYTSKPSWWGNTIPWPAIGPDISSGNVGQCTGTINTVGQMAKVPATSNGQCTGTSLSASQWGGHVNAIPAMSCFLAMGGPPDGSGAALPFTTTACPYLQAQSGGGGSSAAGSGGIVFSNGATLSN